MSGRVAPENESTIAGVALPVILHYPRGRLLYGFLFVLAFIGINTADMIAKGETGDWVRWLVSVVCALGLVHFGSALVARDRFGALRVEADGFRFQLGLWRRRAKFAACGQFYFVDYLLGSDYITWRTRAGEEKLPGGNRLSPPDPSDAGVKYLGLPEAMLVDAGGGPALCDLLNRLRKAAGAGLPENSTVNQIRPGQSGAALPEKRYGRLAPPPIPALPFLLIYCYLVPAAAFAIFYFHNALASGLASAARPIFRAVFGKESDPSYLISLFVTPSLIFTLGFAVVWLARGRLRDLGEEAGYWQAFRHAILAGTLKRRKLLLRKGTGG